MSTGCGIGLGELLIIAVIVLAFVGVPAVVLLLVFSAGKKRGPGMGSPAYPGGPGQPMTGMPGAAPPLPSGTPVLVPGGGGSPTPATVVQAAPGQYLLAFPNGQQVWVPAHEVRPR